MVGLYANATVDKYTSHSQDAQYSTSTVQRTRSRYGVSVLCTVHVPVRRVCIRLTALPVVVHSTVLYGRGQKQLMFLDGTRFQWHWP